MRLENRKRGWLFPVLFCPFALLVAVLPLQAGEAKMPGAGATAQRSSPTEKEPEGVRGKAVYFAKRYNGRRTGSGEIYDPGKLTAAHSSLPYGTRVKVLNLANGRSVVVTINDRCRKRGFELIDLSRAAARELGFLGKGMATVRIIPLEE